MHFRLVVETGGVTAGLHTFRPFTSIGRIARRSSFGSLNQLLQNRLGISNETNLHGEGPAGVALVNVYLDDALAGWVEDVGTFSHSLLGAQECANHQDRVSISDSLVGGFLTVGAHHAQGQRMVLGDGALALVAGGHGHAPLLGQLLQLVVGAGHVDAISGDNHWPFRLV